MTPIGFHGETHLLDKPQCMDREQCEPLPVQAGVLGDALVVQSCWKVTADELAEINRTGCVWLGVWGQQHPPVVVSGHRLNLEDLT